MLRQIPAVYRQRVVRRDQTTGRGATGRALLTGGLLAALIAIGVPYGGMVIQGSRLGLSSATPAAFFLLFVLLLTVQVGTGGYAAGVGVWPRRVGDDLCDDGSGHGHSHARRGGAAAADDHRHLLLRYSREPVGRVDPSPFGRLDGRRGHQRLSGTFYEGVGRDAPIPWDAWLVPLGRWLAFYTAFYLALDMSDEYPAPPVGR